MSIYNRIAYPVLICGMVLLGISQSDAQTAPKPRTGPEIAHSYAIERGRFGDVLKFYLEAEDPDRDMFRIAVVVEQPGYGRYPADWIYLKSEYRGHFIGYLQWNTFSSNTSSLTEWTNIIARVSVFDRAGNESTEVVFPFTFVSEVISKPPLPAPFDRRDIPRLGHINVNLYDPSRMGDGENEREVP